jgi:hypothetical protein
MVHVALQRGDGAPDVVVEHRDIKAIAERLRHAS